MAVITHTVVSGDTLSGIGAKYGVSYQEIARINNIQNVNLIYVGQVLKIKDDGGGTIAPDPVNKNNNYSVTITSFGRQAQTDRTIFAVWTFTRDNIDNYSTRWEYDTGDSVWFIGSEGDEKNPQSIYNAPDNAKKVRFKVKPNSTKRKVNDTEVAYWTGTWSSWKEYSFSDAPPKPDSPGSIEVKIEQYTLTATINNISEQKNKQIQFQVVCDDSVLFASGNAGISTGTSVYSCSIEAGKKYKVRARSFIGNDYSDWTDYTSNTNSMPNPPSGIKQCRGTSATSVFIEWEKVSSAETYDLEYSAELRYFEGSDQVQEVSGIRGTSYEKTGLESGKTYYFRVRATNEQGSSSWSPMKSVTIGEAPGVPTTWASSSTVISGEELILYWVHNTRDGSNVTQSQLQLTIDGVVDTKIINNPNINEKENKTVEYEIFTMQYKEGTTILWKVKTAGVTGEYGEWSVERKIEVVAPPTLTLTLTDYAGNNAFILNRLPLNIKAVGGPSTQKATGYHISIVSNTTYDTNDSLGNVKRVNKGDEIYSKYYDVNGVLETSLSAEDIDFENNSTYSVTCTVSMNSGLTATRTTTTTVSWDENVATPNAEIGIDKDTVSAVIKAYCIDADNVIIPNVKLSVYRREFNGTFTKIASGLTNGNNTYVVDPHPSLDLARYRIVATDVNTGAVSFYDMPGYPVGEKAIIIQWSEEWSNFDVTDDNRNSEQAWTGSMLRLPYNIEVSDKAEVDVEVVSYIGRKSPVSYYGTQTNQTSTWNTEIPKTDKDTIYALRRLSVWSGDVYVREPSGSGYWASIKVSFNQKYDSLTIPITFDITRVEGGM